MSSAPPRIIELVETFDRNIETYHSQQYNETQLRREFIDPFFEELGWDVSNKQGYAQAYKEVIHEDAVKVGTATKAPDYSFRIGGVRKFFLEAKKPSINIGGDPHPAYQLRRYAWSAKLPVSILTDFEEFAVYDCQMRPKQTDGTSTARIMFLTCKDYIDKWGEIADIFSKEAVLKGSFDKFAVSPKGKRGTSTVDKEFLKEIETWREQLAKIIAHRNRTLTIPEINFAVQKTIDRIIFLRMCEDRGIETYGQLQALIPGTRVYPRLCEVFERADEKYNSGLFHFRQEKGRSEQPDEWTLNLVIDDKDLKYILNTLYYPQSPYEFSVLPAEILGNVYEQFLGKVILVSPARHVKIEPKPEVKKAGGIYYTPDYIVDYIVKNTVGRLLGVLPCYSREIYPTGSGNPQPRYSERSEESQLYNSKSKIVNRKSLTPKQVANLRILDPACGSGSFLLGAYTYLLNYHRDWYVESNPAKYTKQIYQGRGGQWFLTIAEKKKILLNNIFGVDIDSQAVEVTKLSLLLKVLEGESQESLLQFHERALPDLGNNIKCGNSLIGPDFFDNPDIDSSDDELRQKINAFDWKKEFAAIFKQGGFDAVIGNPPYVRIQNIDHVEIDYLFAKYKTPVSKTDLSQLFLEHSLNLSAPKGLIGLICSSQWLATDYGKNMRQLLANGKLHEIVNFGSLPVFTKASTYPAIFVLSPTNSKFLCVKKIDCLEQLNLTGIEKASVQKIAFHKLSENSWNLGKLDIPAILKDRSIPWHPLSIFGQAYIGLLTGMDKAFVVGKKEAGLLKLETSILFPYAYRGNEVYRYEYTQPSSLVIYPYERNSDGTASLITENKLKKDFPKIYQHLLVYKNELRQRMDSRKLYATGSEWYRHLRHGSFGYILPPKLIIKGIDKGAVVGMLKEKTAFNGANCPGIIIDKSEKYSDLYFLGIMNSKVISFYLRAVCPAKLNNYTRFNANNVNTTPIRTIDFKKPAEVKKHDKMVSLVEKMLDLHKKLTAAKVPADKTQIQRQINSTDRQIDQLVYELYGLTNEEIRTIEKA